MVCLVLQPGVGVVEILTSPHPSNTLVGCEVVGRWSSLSCGRVIAAVIDQLWGFRDCRVTWDKKECGTASPQSITVVATNWSFVPTDYNSRPRQIADVSLLTRRG